MYGLVNQSVRHLVVGTFGTDAWARIAVRAGVQEDTFLAMSPYPDEITYNLLAAASEVLDKPAEEILETFGEFWVDYAAEQGYAELLSLMGDDLPSFLHALDDMHDRLRLSFPELNPPSIWCTDVSESSLRVHYASDRPGLTPFMAGLLRGTARRFGETVRVEAGPTRADGHDHDEFLLHRTPTDLTTG
jgi:hypothetical protein